MLPTAEYALLRVWTEGNLTLNLYDTGRLDDRHGIPKHVLAYELCEGLDVIFEGADFRPSPLCAIDSDSAVGALLTFLSLRPGDTDSDYFANYTERQLRFADERGEELSMYAYDLENPDV